MSTSTSSKTSRALSACSSFQRPAPSPRSSSKPVKFRSASAVRESLARRRSRRLHAIPISLSERSKADVSEPINPLITAKIRAVFGADQTLTALAPLAGDASSRRYYRAILSGTGTPPSIIVMELPAGSSLPLSSEELAIFKEGPKELPFLNVHRFLSRTGVNVPQILGAVGKRRNSFARRLGRYSALGPGPGLGRVTISSPGIKKRSTSC